MAGQILRPGGEGYLEGRAAGTDITDAVVVQGDGGQSPAVVARRSGWAAIPAVKDDEIIGLNDDIASRWGPRLPQLVAAIAQAVERAKA